jgi:hypothetical protein
VDERKCCSSKKHESDAILGHDGTCSDPSALLQLRR